MSTITFTKKIEGGLNPRTETTTICLDENVMKRVIRISNDDCCNGFAIEFAESEEKVKSES